MTEIHSTPKAARAAGATHYFTGKPCLKGHVALRYASTAQCSSCMAEKAAAYAAASPEKRNETARKSHWRHRGTNLERMKHYAASDPDRRRHQTKRYREAPESKAASSTKRWRSANPERVSDGFRAWVAANPGKARERLARRRAAEVRATPKWLTEEQIAQMEAVYAEAARITQETGIKHDVDHAIPLQGKNVCGLHVPWNLQVMTRAGNQSKGNRIN